MEFGLTNVLILVTVFVMDFVITAHPGPIGYVVFDKGFSLRIAANGTVHGTREMNDPYSLIQLYRAGNNRNVYLYGKKSKKYICRAKRHGLVGEAKKSKKCMFHIDELEEYYTSFSYLSDEERVYLGLTKSGKPTRARRRDPRTKFMWRPKNYRQIQRLQKSKYWSQLFKTNIVNRKKSKRKRKKI